MRLLYYSPSCSGGLADYAHFQANALVDEGAEVDLLCTPDFPAQRGEKYNLRPVLGVNAGHRSRLISKSNSVRTILRNIKNLRRVIASEGHKQVLFGAYIEYLAPLWAKKFKRMWRNDVRFASVIHDPNRDFVVGPQWWHRWSIACGYSFLHTAFVHNEIQLDTVRPAEQMKTTVLPFGPYSFPEPTQSSEAFRKQLNIPTGATMLLSFGHIRDNKNLDLVLSMLVDFPDCYLVVAGKEQAGSQVPAGHYQALAQELGVADRCRWNIAFISESDVGNYFDSCDLVLLTYSAEFTSASAVLASAAHFRKPCLASSGPCNLRDVVQEYQMGVWVEPDQVGALKAGLRQFLEQPPQPRWDDYAADNSWRANARLVLEQFAKN